MFCNLINTVPLNLSCVWIGVYLVLTLQKNCLTFLLGSCNFGTVATTGRKEENVVEPPTCYSIASSRPYTLHHRVATKVKEAAGGRYCGCVKTNFGDRGRAPLFPLPKPHDPELAAQGKVNFFCCAWGFDGFIIGVASVAPFGRIVGGVASDLW